MSHELSVSYNMTTSAECPLMFLSTYIFTSSGFRFTTDRYIWIGGRNQAWMDGTPFSWTEYASGVPSFMHNLGSVNVQPSFNVKNIRLCVYNIIIIKL